MLDISWWVFLPFRLEQKQTTFQNKKGKICLNIRVVWTWTFEKKKKKNQNPQAAYVSVIITGLLLKKVIGHKMYQF